MPYRQVHFEIGGNYHVYNRGNNYAAIFFERENYLFFLRQLRRYLVAESVDVVAYCLMPNHFHLLLHLKGGNLPGMMQRFGVSYSKAINKRYSRVGSLFQGPFKARRVESDDYLLHLSRYIHLNPAKAGLCDHAEDWEFSSYRDYTGLRNGTLVNQDLILSQFRSRQEYRTFVEEYQDDTSLIEHLMLD